MFNIISVAVTWLLKIHHTSNASLRCLVKYVLRLAINHNSWTSTEGKWTQRASSLAPGKEFPADIWVVCNYRCKVHLLSYCFRRQLRQVVRSVSVDAAKTVVHAFISSCLDYCNSLLYGISDVMLGRLQAVRLVTGTRRCNHITPVLKQLHWLPVRQRVEFKLAVLVYKALNNMAPPYLSDDCQLVATTGRRQLRSSDTFKCTITCTGSCLGDRAFADADHAFGTVFLHMFVNLICLWTPFTRNWKRI